MPRLVLIDIREDEEIEDAVDRFLDVLGIPDDDEDEKEFHLPGEHDQEAHGNWATGGGPGAGSPPHVTDTPEFKAWFFGSKVVDEQGKPLVVYHGTRADFEAFRETSNDLGIHFGTPEQAGIKTGMMGDVLGPSEGGNIVPVYLAIKNPLKLNDHDWEPDEILRTLGQFDKDGALKTAVDAFQAIRFGSPKIDDLPFDERMRQQTELTNKRVTARKHMYDIAQRMLINAGYDGAYYDNRVEGGGRSWIAFRPEQIKSIFNRTFDPKDSRISYHYPGLHDQEDHGNWASGGGPGAGSAPHVTDTPEFKHWFSGSKIVDAQGKPLVVYHATYKDFEAFKGEENYFTPDPNLARQMAVRRTGGRVAEGLNIVPVYLSVDNLWDFDNPRHRSILRNWVENNVGGHGAWASKSKMWEAIRRGSYDLLEDAEAQEVIKSAGFNGMRIKESPDSPDTYLVFDPRRIKSKFNKGTFDPKDKRISYHYPGLHDQEDHGNWADSGQQQSTDSDRRWLFNAEREIRGNKDFETAIAVVGGKPVLWKAGDKTSVSFTKQEIEKVKNSVFTHNHPSGVGFSPEDMRLAMEADVAEMRAVGYVQLEGPFKGAPVTYVLRRPSRGWPSWTDVNPFAVHGLGASGEDAFLEADMKVGRLFRHRISTKALTIEEANAFHNAAVTALVAKKIGAEFHVIRVKSGR